MREKSAVYGGESAHHYFRDFYFCDSGMIPWLVVSDLLGQINDFSTLVAKRKSLFPCSGEINFTIRNAQAVMSAIEKKLYIEKAEMIDYQDGLSFLFTNWRFNLRASNTEPLLRQMLRRQDRKLLEERTAELSAEIYGLVAKIKNLNLTSRSNPGVLKNTS